MRGEMQVRRGLSEPCMRLAPDSLADTHAPIRQAYTTFHWIEASV